MSIGRVPSPDFDENRYERPNQPWVCGHACEGCPCRIGPSPGGECRATTECQPLLLKKEGETKGTWKCTRPKEWGGTCESGPNPDGTCCKSITKCQPVRSIRAKRGLVVRSVIALSMAVLLIGFGKNFRESFLNPSPLSQHHSGPRFEMLAAKQGGGQGCVLCHVEATDDFGGLTQAAVRAARTSLTLDRLVGEHPRDFSRMDRSCLACHGRQSMHHPSVVNKMACSACHLDHQGPTGLDRVDAGNCAACHGNAAEMQASARKALGLPAALLPDRPAPGGVAFASRRPPEGFTATIKSFAGDHPEFQAVRPGQTDSDPLKFNHQLHLGSNGIPLVNGRALACADCHQPDVSGAFMQRVTFERNCRACHALNFDERNPGMTLPHGDAALTRAYLRSLPTQYADHAARNLGLSGARALADFVAAQMRDLRDRIRTGEDLERTVFFSDGTTGPSPRIAGLPSATRAKFAGCAYCHTVTPRENAAPVVTPPRIPDRWLLHARFSHAKHGTMACAECHTAAGTSERTSDILIPGIQSCTQCHGPKGGAAAGCTVCHTYHNQPPALLPLAKSAGARP
ncbi:MAG: hypothetical protein EXS32_06635 [Opitutus sp.]|nr:hypothetical protein [Opitutus sp.]